MEKIRLMALGGLDEDGKNMYVVEIDDDIFVIEAGLKYPNESEQLGIEYVIPDFTYLIENKDRVKAIFISHGHDDVMMALTHLLRQIDVPVYATALTAAIIKDEFERVGIRNKTVNVLKRKDTIEISGHTIRTFPVMQSIPDGVGISIDTEAGQIVYTSEFIIDCDFASKAFSMSFSSLNEIGKKGVFALLCESVGAKREGYTAPNHRLYDKISYINDYAEGRKIITVYKQNLFRILEILEFAKRRKYKVFLYDDDHIKLLQHLADLNYYEFDKKMIVSKREFTNDDDNIICVVSGSANRVFRTMNKIALNEDQYITLKSSDNVIIASPIVPGTEKDASSMENDLYKAGVKVFKINSKEILSMHASIEDIKMMIYLMKPKYYIPIKGEYKDLVNNADIAVSMALTPDKIIILDDGQFATFENGKLVSTRDLLDLNDVPIDSSNRNDVASMVLKDRETLSTDGCIVVGVVLDYNTKEVIGGPDVQSRGVIYLKDADHILNEIGNIIIDTIKLAVKENRYDNMQVRLEAREAISRYVAKETGKRPMILPAIVELNLGDNNG